jgi:transketolase
VAVTDREAEQFDVEASRKRCLRMRRRILEISQTVTALHIAPAFSCMEIVETIYSSLMKRPVDGEKNDTFILSKGHGSMAQYTMLEELGVLSAEEMMKYCKPGGILGTHPDYGIPGIEAATGSLGHGLGLAVGMGLADKVMRSNRTIYVVMSDGELQEGSVWEVMLLAPTLGVTNVVAVVDLNDFQSLGRTSEIHPNFYPVVDKVRAFGWESLQVDGHDGPTKGKGVSYMENVPIWHYRSPNPEEYQRALKELTETQS